MSEWVERAYAAVDRKDAAGYAECLTEDVWFRFANNEPVTGRDTVRQVLHQFFSSFETIRHRMIGEWRQDETLIIAADVTYGRRDGSSVTLPGATIYWMRGDQAERAQVFIDVAPLFA